MSLSFENVSFQYNKDDNKLFSNLSFTVPDGELLFIEGKSGSGKTTLLHLAAGLLTPQLGTVTKGRAVSMVFQEDRLCETFSGIENVLIGCQRGYLKDGKLSQNELKERILHEFEYLGLESWAYKPVNLYSGGMKRRVAILRAVLSESSVLLLDEPFTGLDLQMKEKVADFICKNSCGRSILLSSHDSKDIMLFSERMNCSILSLNTIFKL